MYIYIDKTTNKMVFNMKNDFCVRCGSHEINIVKKHLEFTFPNPGTVEVDQECNECQECGETYFGSKQMIELSNKISKEKGKIEAK